VIICNEIFLLFQDLTSSNIFCEDPNNIKDPTVPIFTFTVLSRRKVPPLRARLFVNNFILQGQYSTEGVGYSLNPHK
jgi:hypothetical protein